MAMERIAELSQVSLDQLRLIRGDIRDATMLERLFSETEAKENPIDAVIHFVGLKAVGESVINSIGT